MCMLVQSGFCCFFPSWWTNKLRHSRLAWCWLTNNVLLVNLVGCWENQQIQIPKWLIKKHCQSFEFSKWWVCNFILSLELMSGAFRGRISPCCFLTGHPFAGTKKEKTNRKWVRKRAGKRKKLSFHSWPVNHRLKTPSEVLKFGPSALSGGWRLNQCSSFNGHDLTAHGNKHAVFMEV